MGTLRRLSLFQVNKNRGRLEHSRDSGLARPLTCCLNHTSPSSQRATHSWNRLNKLNYAA